MGQRSSPDAYGSKAIRAQASWCRACSLAFTPRRGTKACAAARSAPLHDSFKEKLDEVLAVLRNADVAPDARAGEESLQRRRRTSGARRGVRLRLHLGRRAPRLVR